MMMTTQVNTLLLLFKSKHLNGFDINLGVEKKRGDEKRSVFVKHSG